MMRIQRKQRISASTQENVDNIFMLMGYTAGDSGMESDDFYCYGKFYANDINDANQQFNRCISKYPNVPSDDMYVTEYNSYFDNFDEYDPYDYWGNEVFENLDVMFKKFSQNQSDYDEYYGDEPLPFTSSDSLTDSTNITASEYDNMYGQDDGFFTKDDIIDLADAVESDLQSMTGENFRYTDVYMSGNTVHVEVTTPDDEVYTTSARIDMRKIRKPSDILKYTTMLVKRFLDEYQGLDET